MRKPHPCLALLLGAAAALAGCRGRRNGPDPASRLIKVTTARPEERVFREVVRVQGTLKARDAARVAARVPGALDALYVDEGDRVEKDQPLFQTDKVNLENNLEVQRRGLDVAVASRREAGAGLAEARATRDKDARDAARFRTLYEEQKAVTLDAFERAQTAAERSAAGLDHAQALVDLSEARVRQAESALRIAEKQLADALVRAPFAGVVVRRAMDPGEFAGAGTVVIELEDPSRLEVAFSVPAESFARIAAGTTTVSCAVAGAPPIRSVVAYRSPTLDEGTRTAEAKAYLDNGGDLAAGMLGDVEVVVAERRGLGVPNAAIGLRGGSPVVFAAEQGRAVQRPVEPGLKTDGFTELRNAEALAGAEIIVEGQTFLNDGDGYRVD